MELSRHFPALREQLMRLAYEAAAVAGTIVLEPHEVVLIARTLDEGALTPDLPDTPSPHQQGVQERCRDYPRRQPSAAVPVSTGEMLDVLTICEAYFKRQLIFYKSANEPGFQQQYDLWNMCLSTIKSATPTPTQEQASCETTAV